MIYMSDAYSVKIEISDVILFRNDITRKIISDATPQLVNRIKLAAKSNNVAGVLSLFEDN